MNKVSAIPVVNKPYLENKELEESERMITALLEFAIQNTDSLYMFLENYDISIETFTLFYKRYIEKEQ